MLESQSRILFVLLAIFICLSVALTYRNTIVEKNFVITNDVEEELPDLESAEEL